MVIVIPRNVLPRRIKRDIVGTEDEGGRGGLSQRLTVTTSVEERYARTLYQNTVDNPRSEAVEVSFWTVLPENAFISRFAIETGGEMYHAEVKEKEEAKKTYKQAKERGKTAGYSIIE